MAFQSNIIKHFKQYLIDSVKIQLILTTIFTFFAIAFLALTRIDILITGQHFYQGFTNLMNA